MSWSRSWRLPTASRSSTGSKTPTAQPADLPLLEVLRRATTYLAGHGSESPRLDAELLLAHSLGLRRLDLYVQFDRPLKNGDLEPYRRLIAERSRGRPVAYLTGRKEFMKLEFEVTDQVLVPNPDTEALVLRAIEWCRARGGPVSVADVGTGSGCIAVSVAHYVQPAHVWAGDDDPPALQVAARNVRRHGLEDRITVVEGDLLEPFPHGLDLVCANLPYVDSSSDLPSEVLAQPSHALLAAEGGAALIRRLLAVAPGWLGPGGAVLAEVDPAIESEFGAELGRYAGHRLHKDLGGRTRVLEAWL